MGDVPIWEHGFEDFKRREDAMIVWNATSWKLAHYTIDNVALSFDFTAAFHCPTFDDLEENVLNGEVYNAADRSFVRQIIHETSTEVVCGDGTVELKHGQGVLMGTSRAPKDFNHTTRPHIFDWNTRCESLNGGSTATFYCKLTNRRGDLAVTKVVDDLHRRAFGNDPHEAWLNAESITNHLNEALGEAYAQNHSKRHALG